MKKLIYLALAAIACVPAFTSCGKSEEEAQKEQQQQAMLDATRDELTTALSDRDSLFVLVNDITEGMNQIKELENILSQPGMKGETASQRQQIRNDIAAIQQAMAERRQRLEQLESKLAKSNLTNNNLTKTIESLKAQLADQDSQIQQLTASLSMANEQISNLSATVDTLSTTVTTVTEERNTAQQQATDLADELNTCYYAIGSNKELKQAKIVEGGFLRKTKIMETNFDMNYFTRADKRTLSSIPCNSKKAQLLTNNPEGSYYFATDAQGIKTLKITNPTAFWSLSNFLVIKID